MLSTEKSEISGQHRSAGATVRAVYPVFLSQDTPLPCRACILLKTPHTEHSWACPFRERTCRDRRRRAL